MGGMPTPEISVAKPIIKNVTLTKDYPGYLTTEKTVNLVARVNGTLQSTSYTAGGRVKQGQLLFVIEPTLYKDKVEQAEACLLYTSLRNPNGKYAIEQCDCFEYIL